jgi:hypothetical protein
MHTNLNAQGHLQKCLLVGEVLVFSQNLSGKWGRPLRCLRLQAVRSGGILSPLLWSLVVDKLLGEINKGYYAIGYADDIAILINGKFPQTVSRGAADSPRTGTAMV